MSTKLIFEVDEDFSIRDMKQVIAYLDYVIAIDEIKSIFRKYHKGSVTFPEGTHHYDVVDKIEEEIIQITKYLPED